ncbi:MAG: hypothetical protein DRP56_06320 [Planctomycetota bacterium]|nr:MAG: hypothetical protein DRP56_06320 [Planctomycetota bacterium]
MPVDNRKWVEYPDDKSAQSIGKHTIRRGIFVHKGNWEDAEVLKNAQSFNSPLRVAQIGRQQGSLPCLKSFIEITGRNLVLSAFKKAEGSDSVIVRLYNPASENIKGKLTFDSDIRSAQYVDLNEKNIESIEPDNKRTIKLTVASKKIISIKVDL